MLRRGVLLASFAAVVRASASGKPEAEGFGQQTWVSRCKADATNGRCMADVTTDQFLDPATLGADGTLEELGSGPDHDPYATYPFRSNDGLRKTESGYLKKFRGRMHSKAGVPQTDTEQPIWGRGGTNQLVGDQIAATGGADGGPNNFNQGGSFTSLDTMFQRDTSSYPTERQTVEAGGTGSSPREHGVFRCTVDSNTQWSAAQIEIDSVKYNPPMQGGSARFMMQTVDFAEGTNC